MPPWCPASATSVTGTYELGPNSRTRATCAIRPQHDDGPPGVADSSGHRRPSAATGGRQDADGVPGSLGKPSRLPATLGDRARDSENFSPALDSRKLIGQAQGILMNASTSTAPAPLRSFAATHKTGTSNYETSPQMVVDTLNCPVFHPVDRARTAALARCYAQRPRRGADGRTRPPRRHEHQG
jgi:hypothetical protein